MKTEEMFEKIAALRTELDKRIIGQDYLKWAMLVCLFSGGVEDTEHNSSLILRGKPGIAKTDTSVTLAQALDMKFSRFQFTADTLPQDPIIRRFQNPKTGIHEAHEGAIFSNIMLCDEVNRAPEKVSGGLLEAMQEGQVTIEGETRELPRPFMPIFTMNPIEQRGTYTLVEAFRDRITMMIDIGYPTEEEELAISRMHEKGARPSAEKVMRAGEVFDVRSAVERSVFVHESVERFITSCVRATRPEVNPELKNEIDVGVSSRGVIWLKRVAKVAAFLDGRDYVTPNDVEKVMGPVLAHRMKLKDEAFMLKSPLEIEEVYYEIRNKAIKAAIAKANERR